MGVYHITTDIRWRNGYCYLVNFEKDDNGKRFERTIACFGKTEPVFKIPFIYRGCSEDLTKNIKNKTINLILTDPPYGLTQNKWDIKPDWKEISNEYNRILKDNGQIAIFGTPPNIIEVFNGFKEKFDFRFEVIWDKGRGGMWTTNYAPMKSHENIYVFKKKNSKTNNLTFNKNLIGIKGKPYEIKKSKTSTNYGFDDNEKEIITKSDGIRFPLSVKKVYAVQRTNKEYVGFPTQKPMDIIEYFVRGLSDTNDIILDPYLGSGTTAIVSMLNARMCIGSEIDPISFPIIKKRIKQTMKIYDVKWNLNNGFLKNHLQSMTEGLT